MEPGAIENTSPNTSPESDLDKIEKFLADSLPYLDNATPTENTANPPLPTDTECKEEVIDATNIAEQLAKAKIEAILEDIENTNFITLTGEASGMHGCVEITKMNGEKTWIGHHASIMRDIANNHDLLLSFVEKHQRIIEIAEEANKPTWKNTIFKSITRTTEASELYKKIANDEIKPKANANRVYRV